MAALAGVKFLSARRFGDTAIDLIAHLVRARIGELTNALGDRARTLFPGVAVEASADKVTLKARRLRSRALTDAALRRPSTWLK